MRNLHTYDSVSKDIVSRWAYPLCPDSNLLQSQSYRLTKSNIYKEEGVILARDCVINSKTVIGRGTSVGDGSVISDSIIGRHCYIGRGVNIEGAYIWDYASIGDGCTIKKSIIANEAALGKRCTVEPGALISYGVAVAEGITIRGEHRITRAKRKTEHGEVLVKGEPDIEIVGQGGDGFEFQDPDEEDEDEIVDGLVPTGPSKSQRTSNRNQPLILVVYTLAPLSPSAESISTLNSDSEDGLDSSYNHNRSAADSFVSVGSQDSYASQHAANFDHDATASIYDSLVEGHESANIQLELTALRMSTNASDHQVRRAVAVSFVKRISQLIKSGSSVRDAVTQVFGQHKALVERSIFDKNNSNKVDQVDFMVLLQAELSHRDSGDLILLNAATKLIEMDVIEEDGMLQWWGDTKSHEGEGMVEVKQKTQQLIDFLNQSSEEESEEDDDDEDEDSE